MKKILFIGVLCILFEFTAQGQNLYSMQNLQQSSPENLRTYLTFAQKQKKTGGTLMTTGAITAVAGIVLASAAYDDDEWIGINTGSIIGGWMFLLGIGATIVGIPIRITGSTREKKINSIINNSSGASLEIAPCNFQNFSTQKGQVGISVRFKF